ATQDDCNCADEDPYTGGCKAHHDLREEIPIERPGIANEKEEEYPAEVRYIQGLRHIIDQEERSNDDQPGTRREEERADDNGECSTGGELFPLLHSREELHQFFV